MKRVLMVILLIGLLGLTACSKEEVYKWEPGVMTGPLGVMTDITEFTGISAKASFNGVDIIIDLEKSIMYCPHNHTGVEEEKMTKYKKTKYYLAYNDTVLVMFYPYGDVWVEGRCGVSADGVADTVAIMHEVLSQIAVSDTIQSIEIGDSMVLNVSGSTFKMRPNEIIIPEAIRIQQNDNSVTMSETVNINDKTLGHHSTAKYDYYVYGDYLIQAALGTDISMIVTFK